MLTVVRAAAAALAAFAVSAGAHAPAPSDLDAVVTYETRHVMPSGITRVDTWQERLVRRGNEVWTERILPATGARDAHDAHEPGHVGHKHFNSDTAARWVKVGADGQLDVKLVDREHQAIVAIPRAEFGTVGFDGSFAAAANIVPAALVRAMKASGGGEGDARWRTDRRDGWAHRVLWSESRQLAMKVESRRDDGSVRRTVSVRLQPEARSGAPWDRLGGYAHKRYDDFMD